MLLIEGILDGRHATKIIGICEREWPAAQDDCNKFVKAVADALSITVTGNARKHR